MNDANEKARTERAALEWENRNCPRCSGSGLAIVFHRRHQGSRVGIGFNGRPFAAEIAAHCDCPVGCATRERTEPRLQARIPWIKDILEVRSSWLLEPPGGEEIEGAQAPTRADIINMFKPVE